MSQRRIIKSKGKTYVVNCPGGDDMGIGAGFPIGTAVLKSPTDLNWYLIQASGSAGSVVLFPSQSSLGFTSGPLYAQNAYTASYTIAPSFFEQNYPYQLLAATDGNAYAVYLTGSAPNVQVVVSQSAHGPAYIKSFDNAYIALAKPYLIFQSITDGNYYVMSLTVSASGSVGYTVDSTLITADSTLITADNSGSAISGSITTAINQTPMPKFNPAF